MKKIFTLIAVAVMAIGAQAQTIFFGEGDVCAKGSAQASYASGSFVLNCTDTDKNKHEIDANNAYFGDATSQEKLTHRLKTSGKSSAKNALSLTIPEAGTLKVYVRTGSNSATDRNLVLTQGSATLYNQIVKEADAIAVKGLDESDLEKETNVYPVIVVAVTAGTVNIEYPVNGLNFYGFELVAGEGGGEEGGETQGTAQLVSWNEAKAKGSAAGTYGDGTFKFVGIDTDASKHEIDANNAYFGDATTQIKFAFRYKTGGKSSAKNAISLTIPAKGKVLVYARTGSNSATDRNIVLTQSGATILDHILLESEAILVKGLDAADPEKDTNVYPILEANVVAGTVDVTYPVNSINIYGVQFVPDGAEPITGIQDVKANAAAVNAPAYNLAGQKVGADFKGLVIKNGVKFLNK